MTSRGVPKTGAYNFGGSIVTAGGLVFIGATHDEIFRACVIAAGGGGKPGTKSGDEFVAFALG
ncbi:MAG TPA: hypothetical protein VML01_05750 [Bryobacterales bacterium]|nr:hypothetical protein [Bryobacterales bacterium]